MAINFDAYIAKAKKKDQEQYQQMVADTKQRAAAKTTAGRSELAPVKTTTKTKTTTTKKKDSGSTWLKKGSYFDDGYDRWDLTKTILGTGVDVAEKLTSGFAGAPEKLIDSLLSVGTAMSRANMNQANFNMMSSPLAVSKKGNEYARGLVSQNDALQKESEKKASEIIAKDLYNEDDIAKKLISAPVKEKTGLDAGTASVMGDKLGGIVKSIGNTAATKLVGTIFGGGMGYLMTGFTAGGGEVEEALREGATFEGAMASGIITGSSEAAGGMLFNGVKLGGQTLTENAVQYVARALSGKTLQTLAKWGINTVGEGAEEVVSDLISSIGKKLTYLNEKEFNEIFSSQDAWESFLGGMITGGLFEGTDVIAHKIKGTDYVTGLSNTEQKVVDKEIESLIAEKEAQGEKLTSKDKKKIRDEVYTALEKGYISTDTIESVLGGKDYESYKKATDDAKGKEKTFNDMIEGIQNQMNTLQQEYDTLNKMKRGEMTGEQQDRQASIKQELAAMEKNVENLKNGLENVKAEGKTTAEGLKATLGENVRKLVEGSKLEETYRELDRAKESFKADASKFEGSKHSDAAKKTLENAVKANANNTNRVRDLVELQATIAGDTGTVFDFRSGEQIKTEFIERQGKRISELESIPEAERTPEQTEHLASMKTALEKVKSGETVINGVITDEGIVLNLDSDKLLNRTTGHEITHRLEKTGAYADLKEALFKYAESKGLDIKGKLAEIEALYDGVENSTKAEAELVSELVGDYLLTDYDFIKQISVENRNVFQRLWDEVKYLCKVASAGSKEAREFEKVKRSFEKAYKEAMAEKSTADEGGVRYSLSNIKIPARENLEAKGKLKVIDISVAQTKGTYANRRSQMQEKIEKAILQPYLNKDTQTWVFLTKKSYEHAFSNKGSIQLNAIEHLPELIENAVLTHAEEITHGSTYATGIYTFFAAVKNGKIFPVKLKVKEFAYKGQQLPENIKKYFNENPQDYAASYDTVVLEVDEIEESSFGSVKDIDEKHLFLDPNELSEISIADLFELVNEKYKKYLPEKKDVIAENKELTKQQDSKYLSTVENGDVETAQHMVDEVAKKNGYDSPVLYHGTHSFGFTSFDLNKMDDKRSIFLTSSKEIASTYSGVTGSKEIGKDNTINVADMSAEDIVKRLNEYDAEFKTGTTEGPHNYELYDFKKTNTLISKVNDGIEKLKGIVGKEIKSYADRMARDFNDKDAKIHSQLVVLAERLDRYDYENLSTPIYMLLHHTDVFKGSAEIAELEKNIRLMNQVRRKDLSTGVIVDEALGGYVIEIMEIDQARDYLENRLKAGNYSLYARLGKTLEIDGKGALWKDIRNWTSAIEVKPADVTVVKKGDFYELVDKNTNEVIEGGSFAVNSYTDELALTNKDKLRSLMVNNANYILRINTETMNTTREIAKFAKERGYDSVVFKNIRDNGGWNSEVGYDEVADIYVVFDEKSVKSADAVTYDDSGEVIPLSERFKDDNADIRFSLTSDNSSSDYFVAPMRHEITGKDFRVKGADGTTQNTPTAEQQEFAPVGRVPIETKKQKLQAKAEAYQTEVDKNIQLRNETAAYYDEKISTAEEAYNALKNKHSKKADRLQRSIERNKRLKASAVADFEKRINEGQSRLDALNEELDKNPKKAERIERYKEREAAKATAEKEVVTKQYEEKKLQLQRDLNDAVAFVGNRALEMYEEIRNSQKGVRYSKELGYLLDLGFTYKDLKSTLLKVGHNPDILLNPNSEIENEVRKAIGRDLEAAKQQLKNIDTDLQNELERIETEAQQRVDAYQVANQRIIKQAELEGQMAELIGDTTSWKDKKLGLQYKVNTLRRNLRDIVRDEKGNRDIIKADAIYDELQGKYNQHEAQLNREANSIKNKFAEMKITKAEDTYIQMLGELRSNPDTKLQPEQVEEFYKKHKKQIDTEKVDKIIEDARELYNELLDRVNETLSEHGMQEIPHRQGYFPHFTEEKQGVIAKLLNWKTRNDDIPTDIAGMTESFQPNRSWQAFNKRRTGDDTVYSFTKGLDIYLKGSLDWIYHIEDIQKRRAFENQIRYVHSDEGIKEKIDALKNNGVYDAEEFQKQLDLIYKEAENPLNNFVADFRTATNTLAGKKSTIDRTMEELTNRKVYSTMTNLYNRVSANMVAGSVSSALTNFIPITQSWGEVSPLSSVRALGETIVSAFRDDGTVDKSDFLTNRLRANENLNKTAWDKIGDAAGALMDVVDGITSQTVWRSKYNENISKGMSENEAIRNADRFAENVLAGRSRGNMPTIFDSKNPLFKTFTVFQLEVANQYGYMFKDMPQDVAEKSKLKLAKGYATMFLGAYVYNALYSSLAGRDAAFDPVGIVEDLLKDFGVVGKDGLLGEIKDLFEGEDDEEEEKEEFVLSDTLSGFAKNIAEELPFIGGLLGGGRIPLDSALPYGTLNPIDAIKETVADNAEGNLKGITREWLKPVLYLALPLGGGQLKKTNEGLMMFSDKNPVAGSYTDIGSLRFPVEDTLGNRIQAAVFGQYASKNARTYFDEGLAPLKKKEIQEFIELDVPIADYWQYKEGLNNLKPEKGKKSVTNNQKGDYIGGLDFPVSKKNILINNILDRDEPVDMTHYGKYEDFEEFDFATRNPELYKVLQREGVSVKEYKENEEKFVTFRNDDYSWAANNPDKATFSKAFYDSVVDYRKMTSELYDIKADKDEDGNSISGSAKEKKKAYIWSLDIPEGAKHLLFRSEYNSYDDYNAEIIEYVNGLKLTTAEKKTVLEKAGFKVEDNGRITWD